MLALAARAAHHVELVHDDTAQQVELALLNHAIDEGVGLLNGADNGATIQGDCTWSWYGIVSQDLPAYHAV